MDRYHSHVVGVFQLFFVAIVVMEARVNCQGVASSLINITFLDESAVQKGAVCLDGSSPAYYYDSGFGDGATNWLVFLKGGAWCDDKYSCLDRSRSKLGSTKFADSVYNFTSILNPNQDTNPDFYNWNRVFVYYCDGASFMADVEAVDPETNLYRRGRRIFSAIMDELIAAKRMSNATNALLVGESAGGLATILNCDRFHSYLPNTCRVKCFSDSGFFIQAPNLPGVINRENYYSNVARYHELARYLPESCTSRLAPNLCLFAENLVGDVQTPLFLLDSAFDQYQISTNVKPNPPEDQGWKECTSNFKSLQKCTSAQLQIIKDYQTAFLETMEGLDYNPSRGYFINSCFIHAFLVRGYWQETPIVANQSIRQAFGDWYFDRNDVRLMDKQHPYPINCE